MPPSRGGAARRRRPGGLALAAVVGLALTAVASGAKRGGAAYTPGSPVTVFATKTGPFKNPSETYAYYSLPFCPPANPKHKADGLGAAVAGSRRVAAPYDLAFRTDVPAPAHLCARTLNPSEVASLRSAVAGDWYYEFLVDDLPVYGFLGRTVPPPEGSPPGTPATLQVFTRLHFDLAANGDRVVEASASADVGSAVTLPPPPEPGTPESPLTLTFTYTAAWKDSDTPPAKRMDRYARETFLPHHLEVHYFSILNSGATALLLTGFLATILARVLRADVRRYGAAGGLLADGGELGSGGGSGALYATTAGATGYAEEDEAGWKQLHADVFRFPPAKAAFCAAIGTGAQLLTGATALFAASLFGAFRPHARGGVAAAGLGLYAATAGVAGYVGGSYYRQLGGRAWVRCTLATAACFCGPLFGVFCVNNSVALAYHSTAALPAGTIASLVALWAAVTLPLTIIGAVLGKNTRPEFYAPVRTAKFPREIPPQPWWRGGVPQVLAAGALPFSAIYIELYYVFLSVWGHKSFTVWPVLAALFAILLVVTAFVSVALTYFQLAAEDHRWWWRSFACGASTGAYVMAYATYFYAAQTNMGGVLQAAFYFGYNGVAALGLSLMLGFVGWRASLAFVRTIYRAIKCD